MYQTILNTRVTAVSKILALWSYIVSALTLFLSVLAYPGKLIAVDQKSM